MGAGIDPKVLAKRKYGRLKTIQRQLSRRGISATYKNLELQGPTYRIYYGGLGPASNGESFHFLVLRFNETSEPSANRKVGQDEDYGDSFFVKNKSGTYEQGIQRILGAPKPEPVVEDE